LTVYGEDKLIRRSYWLDMDDRTLVMVMVNGIGANLTNDEKRAHLIDLRREHLIDKVCIQEILPLGVCRLNPEMAGHVVRLVIEELKANHLRSSFFQMPASRLKSGHG
jgi:hypothetical protein